MATLKQLRKNILQTNVLYMNDNTPCIVIDYSFIKTRLGYNEIFYKVRLLGELQKYNVYMNFHRNELRLATEKELIQCLKDELLS